MSLHTGVQRGPVGGMVVVVPWASITTWHVWVSFDCISDQLHKQEKNFAPDGVEWELWCKCVCVGNRAQQSLWHLFKGEDSCALLVVALFFITSWHVWAFLDLFLDCINDQWQQQANYAEHWVQSTDPDRV